MGESDVDWAKCQERLSQGDRTAYIELARLITSVLAQLRAYDFADEWDDLRQEVSIAVLTNARAGRLRDPQAFVGYVRIITRNKLFDRIKRRAGTRERIVAAWEDETARAMLDRAALAQEKAAEDAHARDLWASVATLPEQDRHLIEGVYREGHTYEEMASRTGMPLGTLKKRLGAALRGLRAILGPGSEREGSQ
jgi:RNA polymerase sigma-70 factor, ECF subfamily